MFQLVILGLIIVIVSVGDKPVRCLLHIYILKYSYPCWLQRNVKFMLLDTQMISKIDATNLTLIQTWYIYTRTRCDYHPRLNHIYVRLGPAPPTPPSLHSLLANTYVGTLPHWEPMWQYPVKITNIQVDITFIIPKLIDGVNHMPKELNGLSDRVLSRWFPIGKSPTQLQARRPSNEGGVGGAGPSRTRMWFNSGLDYLNVDDNKETNCWNSLTVLHLALNL